MINNYLTYLIESAICFALLYAFYKYVFYKSTHFEWNRFYLVSIVFISIIIPIIPFPSDIILFNINDKPIQFLNPLDGTALVVITNSKTHFWETFSFFNKNNIISLNNILLIIYLSGLLRFAIVNFKNNLEVILLIKNSDIIKEKRYKIVKTNSKQTAFTWFRYIFLNPKYYSLPQTEQIQIFEHEKIHAKQLHSIDILIFQALEIVFWFNPFINKAKHTIKEIHEFIVDFKISKKNNINDYSDLIVKLSFNKFSMQAANLFSKFPIKDRLQLLAFPLPKKLKKISFLGGIPVMILIIISYSFTINQINKSTNKLQFFKNIDFQLPVKDNFEIISNFYVNQEFEKKSNKNRNTKILISHPEISFSTESFTDIYATSNGIITNIDTFDNWGVEELIITLKHNTELTSIYKGLWKINYKENEIIKKNKKIGKTGDKRLYPIFNYQLLKNSQPVDPFIYITY
ncbi:MAG: peptidoglycan DD-metalloendopeptidase family protein [Bacteroidales bacterium]|nr:peptidoglycan DD-metalloendopeptidase family protein [Bacteroidales bacterium]MBN2758235.1 peptidoglycan DD-metalloendopeptidase family protein [Bacteroidales bacterium]